MFWWEFRTKEENDACEAAANAFLLDCNQKRAERKERQRLLEIKNAMALAEGREIEESDGTKQKREWKEQGMPDRLLRDSSPELDSLINEIPPHLLDLLDKEKKALKKDDDEDTDTEPEQQKRSTRQSRIRQRRTRTRLMIRQRRTRRTTTQAVVVAEHVERLDN